LDRVGFVDTSKWEYVVRPDLGWDLGFGWGSINCIPVQRSPLFSSLQQTEAQSQSALCRCAVPTLCRANSAPLLLLLLLQRLVADCCIP